MTKLTNKCTLYLEPKSPYSFDLTMHKPAGWNLFTPFEVYEKKVLWTALHVDGVLLGLKLSSSGTTARPKIQVRVFSRNKLPRIRKESIRQALVLKLAADEDLSGFYRLAKKDRILKHTLEDLYGMHDTDFSHLFAAGILAVCLQMAPLQRSEQMMKCIIDRYGETAVFDGKSIRVWPLPGRISGLDPAGFARACKLGYRAKYIVRMAHLLESDAFPSLEELRKLTPGEAREKLQELPGIGEYSADIINPYGGFPIDVWSADIFGKLFYGKEPDNGRRMIERIKQEGIRRWGGWTYLAFVYVVHDLKNLSKKLGTELRLS